MLVYSIVDQHAIMKKGAIFLFLCCISLILQAQKPEVYQDTIPFRNDLGIITIPITFNGVEKQFAFDTGAEVSLAFSWAKDELKPTSKVTNLRSSNGSRTKLRYYKSGNIELGSRKITKHKILIGKDSDIFSCYNIDGVLGVDITQHFNWVIDFEKKILIMSPSDFYPDEVKQMHALEFEYKNTRPSIFMKMNGKKIKFLLDTGAVESDVNKKKYRFIHWDEYTKMRYYSGFYDFNGTLTKTASTIVQLPEIKSKNVTINPIVDYSNQTTKIGNKLWEGKRLFMSLKNETLYVSDARLKNNTTGYESVAVIKGKKMVVLQIKEGSEAWNIGVRQGDEIKTINGKVFTDFCSLNKYQVQAMKDEKDFEWVLASGKIVTIQKKEFFTNP